MNNLSENTNHISNTTHSDSDTSESQNRRYP